MSHPRVTVTLKSTACNTPNSDYFKYFHGVTMGVGLFVIYLVLLWMVARVIIIRHTACFDTAALTKLDRNALSRLLLVLTLTFEPVTETTLSAFNCRRIGDAYYLREEPTRQCYVPGHAAVQSAAIFWSLGYVGGVLLFYYAVLRSYRIPEVAAYYRRCALLRAVIENALVRHQLPSEKAEHLHTITVDNVSDEMIDALFNTFLKEISCREGDIDHILKQPREHKIHALLHYSETFLHHHPVTWHEVARDPRIAGAQDACGVLFEEYHVSHWHWAIVEGLNKIALAGVLGFVAPGSDSQIVAGMGMTLAFFLYFVRSQPYKSHLGNRIGSVLFLILFLNLTLGLFIRARVRVVADSAANKVWYDASAAVLLLCVIFIPVLLTLRRLSWCALTPSPAPLALTPCGDFQ